jgi:hypothetical protein
LFPLISWIPHPNDSPVVEGEGGIVERKVEQAIESSVLVAWLPILSSFIGDLFSRELGITLGVGS